MNKTTLLEINFISNTVKVMRIDNGYKNATEFEKNYADFRKYAWKCLHSPKVIAVTFITATYRKDIISMVRYCEMQKLPVDIIIGKQKLHTSQQFQIWFSEQQTSKDEWKVSVECVQLIAKHARELMPYLKKGIDVLIEVLRSQIKASGYDVDMQSLYITDGLNHGKIDDSKGIREWSRDYTKHYERYQQTLIDLINMYISCKFYKQAGLEPETDGIGRHDTDSYTGGSLTTASPYAVMWNARHDYGKVIDFEIASALCTMYNISIEEPFIKDRADEDIVVPVSACGEYTQMYMN